MPISSPKQNRGEGFRHPTQPRFWNETHRLLGLFERYREADDYQNATAAFGALARYRFDEMTRRGGYDPGKPSIVSIFQPKSGGTFLHNRLLQLGYQEFWWMYPHRHCHSMTYSSDEALGYYLSGGCACHSHARPDPNILAAFDRAGVDKIWLHLRNPAEAAVSGFHHYLGEGHGRGEVGAERREEALGEAHKQGVVEGVDASAFALDCITFYVKWVADWLSFAEAHPGLVVISYYDELADLQTMMNRVFAEFGVADIGVVPTAVTSRDRYRTKRARDWRDEMSAEASEWIEMRVRAELQRFEAFPKIWH